MQFLITGGTGFFGKSILSWLQRQNLGIAKILVLSRKPERINEIFDINSFPFEVSYITQDIREQIVLDEPVDYVIHAAAESSTSIGLENPMFMRDVVVEGTKNVLEYARKQKVKRVLFVSSGAVYGKQPSDLSHIPENYRGAPDPLIPQNAYGCAKRQAENLCALYHHHYNVDYVVARCFAFVGPYLPLDAHFAIGNFIRDGIKGSPIVVKGDGTPYRSYLYSDDLAEWLWTILLKGNSGEAYNVGSDEAITIKDLAYKVSGCFDSNPEVIIKQKSEPGGAPERYVPNINKIRLSLEVQQKVSLEEAIRKTIYFHIKRVGKRI